MSQRHGAEASHRTGRGVCSSGGASLRRTRRGRRPRIIGCATSGSPRGGDGQFVLPGVKESPSVMEYHLHSKGPIHKVACPPPLFAPVENARSGWKGPSYITWHLTLASMLLLFKSCERDGKSMRPQGQCAFLGWCLVEFGGVAWLSMRFSMRSTAHACSIEKKWWIFGQASRRR